MLLDLGAELALAFQDGSAFEAGLAGDLRVLFAEGHRLRDQHCKISVVLQVETEEIAGNCCADLDAVLDIHFCLLAAHMLFFDTLGSGLVRYSLLACVVDRLRNRTADCMDLAKADSILHWLRVRPHHYHILRLASYHDFRPCLAAAAGIVAGLVLEKVAIGTALGGHLSARCCIRHLAHTLVVVQVVRTHSHLADSPAKSSLELVLKLRSNCLADRNGVAERTPCLNQ